MFEVGFELVSSTMPKFTQPRVSFVLRQGRESEATEAVFYLYAKKPLYSGSQERRVPKMKNPNIFLYV